MRRVTVIRWHPDRQASAEQLYKAGSYVEVGGDLQAITIYQDLLKRFPASGKVREASSTSACCYEKLARRRQRLFRKSSTTTPSSRTPSGSQGEAARLPGHGSHENRKLPSSSSARFGQARRRYGDVTLDGRYLTFVDWETGDLLRDLVAAPTAD
jgi:hypothetical protein